MSTPVRVLELRDEGAGLDAVVVIDTDLFPVAAGGTRMLPDVDREEVARLARAMTWKFAACRVPYSGAKAGVRFEGGDRAAILVAYRRALEPYRESFLTGPDMGTEPADFVEDGAAELPLWAKSHEGIDMDDLATGHGVKAAAEAALEHLGRRLEGSAVAIEGFGKVGSGTARACAKAGARVVAVSTMHGLLVDPTGLDVAELYELRDMHGDRLVEHGPAAVRPREELFEIECDVLVPGARPHVVTAELAERGPWAVIAPGANVPYAPGAIEVLHGRGVVALPDFVSNSGGVHLYESVAQDEDPALALETIERLVRQAVERLLATSARTGTTPMRAALDDARDYLAETTSASAELLDELFGAPGS
jgi:glutamate dehydrogenase (NAD(P)+)